jgi:hypothetical protein
MYDLLKREDVDWRRFNLQAAKGVYQQNALGQSRLRAEWHLLKANDYMNHHVTRP